MPSNTAIIIVDPYNDFLHPRGKLNGILADSLKETDTITHLKELVTSARLHKIPIYYGLHQQCKAGFIAGWNHATPLQKSQKENLAFQEGSWGVDIYEGLGPSLENGDVVVSKHWSSRSVLVFVHELLGRKLMGSGARSIVPILITSFDRGILRTL
jgi:nicotinamidase-related amidase